MSRIDDIEDLIHEQLMPIAAGVRPPDVRREVRHLPNADLLEAMAREILVPILSGVVSGILAAWVTRRHDSKEAATLVAELQRVKELCVDKSSSEHDAEFAANECLKVIEACSQITTLHVEPSEELRGNVETVLRKYHVAEKIAESQSKSIVAAVVSELQD